MVERALLRRNLDVFDLTGRYGNKAPIFPQTLDMKRNGLTNLSPDFLDACTCCNAPRQVGNISGVIAFSFFDYDGVAHRHLISSNQTAS